MAQYDCRIAVRAALSSSTVTPGFWQTAIILRSRASIRAAASGILAAISGGTTTTPCWSPCSRSPGRIHSPPTLTGSAEVDHVDVRVGDGHVRREEVEAERPRPPAGRARSRRSPPRGSRAPGGCSPAPRPSTRPGRAARRCRASRPRAGPGLAATCSHQANSLARWPSMGCGSARIKAVTAYPTMAGSRGNRQTMSEDTKPVFQGFTLKVSIALATGRRRDAGELGEHLGVERGHASSSVCAAVLPGSGVRWTAGGAAGGPPGSAPGRPPPGSRVGSTARAFSKYSAALGRSSF